VSGVNKVGHILSSDDVIWGRTVIENTYYLNGLSDVSPCGGFDGEVDGINASTESELQDKNTFTGWDFAKIWAISEDQNGGYPYFQWQESQLTDIGVCGITLKQSTLSLSVGDYCYLSANISPVNASNQSITWSSDAPSVATVTSSGKVIAMTSGTAIITAKTEDGGYTATCTVTVTERTTEEYTIDWIMLYDNDGAALDTIPNGECLATISITNVASQGNTMVFLASYTSEGQYKGLMWVNLKGVPVGATIEVTLPVDNTSGNITQLKAFVVASFGNMQPIGSAKVFPEV